MRRLRGIYILSRRVTTHPDSIEFRVFRGSGTTGLPCCARVCDPAQALTAGLQRFPQCDGRPAVVWLWLGRRPATTGFQENSTMPDEVPIDTLRVAVTLARRNSLALGPAYNPTTLRNFPRSTHAITPYRIPDPRLRLRRQPACADFGATGATSRHGGSIRASTVCDR